MDVYSRVDDVPLSFTRLRNGLAVSGLSVTVAVRDAEAGTSFLAATACPEIGGQGLYTYNWFPAATVANDTLCLVTYSVAGYNYSEYIFITKDATGGQSA